MTKRMFLGDDIIIRCFPNGIDNPRFNKAFNKLTNKHLHVKLKWGTDGYDKLLDAYRLVDQEACNTAKYGWYLTPRLLKKMEAKL